VKDVETYPSGKGYQRCTQNTEKEFSALGTDLANAGLKRSGDYTVKLVETTIGPAVALAL
jgi:hypothetical protein